MALFLIALRNLFGEKGRFMITVGGVAFSVTLILVLSGLYLGWQTQITRFLGNIPADIWVGQKGSKDMSHTVSLLPTNLENQLRDTPYVDSVRPFVGRQASFEISGKEAHLFLIGVDQAQTVQPYKLEEGRSNLKSGEIVVDKTFAREKKLKLGDVLKINKTNFTIVGISSGGNLLVYSYALVPLDDLRTILDFRQFNNYYLVQSSKPLLAKEKLKEKFDDLAILERQQFLENNAALVKDTFLPIVGVLLVIAAAIGVAVIGLTIFTATIEKSREYGVLKAIGYASGGLYGVALIQSIVAGLVGFAVGWGLSLVVVWAAQNATSAFIYELGGREIAMVFAATLVMSALASLIPLRRLVAIDPAMVFKA